MRNMLKISGGTKFWRALMFASVLGLAGGWVHAQQTETWLGLAVTYAERGYALNPWPGVALDDVKVLAAEPITIKRLVLSPDWAEWLGTARTSRLRGQASEIVATPASLARLGIIEGKSSRKLTLLRFDKMKLRLGAAMLDLPSGQMHFGEDGTLTRIDIRMEDKVELSASPKDGKLLVMVRTAQWKWDVLPALLFDGIVAQGEMTDSELVLSRIGATADGGSVSGSLRIAAPKGFVVEGQLKLVSVRAKDVLDRLYGRHTVQGNVYGTTKIAASADSWSGLGERVHASGSFQVRMGSIDRLGLLEGMRKVAAGPAGGGLTRFETLTGTFNARAGQPVTVSLNRLDGGALQASGNFSVSAEGSLKGWMSGSMRLPSGEETSRRFGLAGRTEAPALIVQ